MSTPSLVPMISQDGSIGDIPAQNVDAALSRGFKRGVNVISKDGQKGTIPLENLGQAMQQGIMPEGAMMPRRPMNQGSPSILQQIDSGITAVGSALNSAAASGLGLRGMFNPAANAQRVAGAIQGVQNQPTTGSKIAAAAAPFVNVDANAVQQAAIHAGKTRDYGPLVATGVLPIATAHLATSKVGPQVDASGLVNELASGEINPKPALSDAAAAQKITDAVNPAPRQMAKFQANVEKQMPNIRQFITEKPKSPGDLLNVVQQAAAAKKQAYYDNIIGPNSDVNVPAPSMYKGETAGNGAATIAQLDKRLTQINDQLSGAYDKPEGASQIQALSGPDKIALKAESAQIRDVMNEELGTRTGMGKQAVAQARSDFGQLRDISNKLQQAISRQRYYENAKNQAPISPADVTAAGIGRQLALKGIRSVIGTPQERAIKGAF